MARKKSATKKAREAARQHNKVPEQDKSIQDIKKKVSSENSLKPKSKPLPEVDLDDESDGSSSSSSEDEDELGDLVTDDVEQGINEVLNAIRNNDTDKLLNPEVKFFGNPEDAAKNITSKKTDKPIYLKDYHRMNLLSGHVGSDDDEEDDETANGEGKDLKTIDGKPSFVAMQRDERNQLLTEINDAFGTTKAEESDNDDEDDDGDDGFLKKKENKTATEDDEDVNIALPDPANEDEFLNEFMGNQAWLPRKGDKVIDVDFNNEDDDEFDKAAETFENAYNFRYEDPNSAEIVSYARNQATLRRSATNSRRRKREDERQEKENEKNEKDIAVQKKKTKKANKLTDVLNQLKKEFGAEIDEKLVKKISKTLLTSDYSENDWDNVVTELFNEEFYNDKEKPEWDDDLMHEDVYDEGENDEEGDAVDQDTVEEENEEVDTPKKTKKSKKEIKQKEKSEKKKLDDMVEKALEQNKLAIVEEVEKEQEQRGRSKNVEDDVKFRYREVSPESFGLTHREIFAADDADLNDFISLKKFAPYRAKELIAKDKRKVTKSKRLRDWRKKVFNNEAGIQLREDGEPNEDIPVHTDKQKHGKKRSHDDRHSRHRKDKKHKSHKK
ncbi:similar to Saccharomyces cerevisiae YNL308C KRI1 Essential nucleolar protein required for 40S ribosome biogenesis [Maudiozyma saulgeensis]|uniref:Similar to Saccharomyces cerevisiae YNL308C KRI1 Essential nucleolar protein required for 40S ribosome biogenesis n=1 Tax=Maudiozyma saulgeensis TaxID=1789683 RepID=A0A1X7R1U9_9SACH|nr:similar to Saccharomyces cerevisiae YNL308C KRI1 Essential nucleolar protein required for 40S ribosome biogenesis [Kazachstania saulgeensis]